uniref:Uncharacterized protein n=1 Tax=Rhizophora mucronata TaxID=61149 RepID=A0A2P2MDA9_RHIMU
MDFLMDQKIVPNHLHALLNSYFYFVTRCMY